MIYVWKLFIILIKFSQCLEFRNVCSKSSDYIMMRSVLFINKEQKHEQKRIVKILGRS
jgi:hypothetical protein